MALDARIRELTARHQALDSALGDELKRPALDSTRVSAMKKEKLRLKDEIAQLARAD